jgi:glyoxalase family protein
MRLEGVHHITAITGDAQANVDFYVGVLGLRLVKRSVNQDDPTVYHLFYADEKGSPGSDITFFEYPGAAPGRPGAGMIHRVVWRVASADAVDFWAERLAGQGVEVERQKGGLLFADPEGLDHELVVDASGDEPLIAEHPEIPAELALHGFDGARAYSRQPDASRRLLEGALGFAPTGDGYEVRGERRGSRYAYDEPPEDRGIPGGGTIHHVAWASPMDDHLAWRERVIAGGARPTPVIDRYYFRSIYFREPSGVLFEIATIGPGFTVDEDADHLGEGIALAPDFEPMRAEVERRLTPLENPRERWAPR